MSSQSNNEARIEAVAEALQRHGILGRGWIGRYKPSLDEARAIAATAVAALPQEPAAAPRKADFPASALRTVA